MADTAIGIRGIGQVALRVGDLRAAIAFYRDVLGLPLLFEAPPGLAFFACGSTRLMLSAADADGGAGPAFALYFTVADIRAAASSFAAHGGTLTREPHVIARLPHAEVWMAFLEDPSGHTLALMSEVPRA